MGNAHHKDKFQPDKALNIKNVIVEAHPPARATDKLASITAPPGRFSCSPMRQNANVAVRLDPKIWVPSVPVSRPP